MATITPAQAKQACYDAAYRVKAEMLRFLNTELPMPANSQLMIHALQLMMTQHFKIQHRVCPEPDFIALAFLSDCNCTAALFKEARRQLRLAATDHSQAMEVTMHHLLEESHYLRGFTAAFVLEYVTLYFDLCLKQQSRRRCYEKILKTMPQNAYGFGDPEIYCIMLCLSRHPELWDKVAANSSYSRAARLRLLSPLMVPCESPAGDEGSTVTQDYAVTVESFAFVLGDIDGFRTVKDEANLGGKERQSMMEAYFESIEYTVGSAARTKHRKRENVCLGCGAARDEGDATLYKKCSLCGVGEHSLYLIKAC